ncbi:polysaccharide (de)acetylase [Calditrichota bacterium GD2]
MIFQKIVKHLSNIPGLLINSKIIVFESDDWGSIRMPSLKVYETLKSKGLDLDSGDTSRYNQNDTLASADDLIALFEVLSKFKDSKGSNTVFTAISLVANPDFEKIRKNNFRRYYYEPFTQTLKRYNREEAFQLWREGVEKHLFVPQFHGREHLNVPAWMRALQNNDQETRLAFDYGFWGFNRKSSLVQYQAAFDLEASEDLEYQKGVIEEGLQLFKEIHSYAAEYFVPPNGPFNNSLEEIAAENGIKFMSAAKIQREALGSGKTRKVFHYLGQKNKYGQTYITRNCFFEPSLPGKNWVDSCLKDIEIAFRWKKPAVISTHRVNYIGSLNPKNRDNGLRQLDQLLTKIIKNWPDVEFMTSTELGEYIIASKQK